MIVVYPMLTSPGVSPNVLPGIIKAVEKYLLVYRTDEVLRHASTTSAGKILKVGGQILAAAATAAAAGAAGAAAASILSGKGSAGYLESDNQNFVDKDFLNEKEPQQKNTQNNIGTQVNVDVNMKGGGGGDKPQLSIPTASAVSLEPTWLQITTEKSGMQLLGVKVVPFMIKSPNTVVSILNHDQSLKLLHYLVSRYLRLMARVILRIIPKFIGMRGHISGNIKKDVIYADTKYKDNMFICLSQLDLDTEESFASDQKGVRKLHKLGWASFIIANDVNRTGTFCMKEFGGVCSVIPYSYMFASLGKDQVEAYKDLEDIKKKSGPFFRMSTNRKRVFSSEASVTVVDKYLELLEKENE